MGAQYPKNMGILLRGLPELSFGLALGRNDENWLGECHSKRFCFGFTPIHSLSAEIQPFYSRPRNATSPPKCHFMRNPVGKLNKSFASSDQKRSGKSGAVPGFLGIVHPTDFQVSWGT